MLAPSFSVVKESIIILKGTSAVSASVSNVKVRPESRSNGDAETAMLKPTERISYDTPRSLFVCDKMRYYVVTQASSI